MRKIVSVLIILSLMCSFGITAFADYEFADFPESYRPLLTKLRDANPGWNFEAFDTDLSWDEVVKAELKADVNLVPVGNDTNSTWKVIHKEWFMPGDKSFYTTTSGSGWVQASEPVIRYFLDPRNFLNTNAIFQFELLSFNPDTQTMEGVEKILEGTFMQGAVPDEEITYAELLMEIAEQQDISPYHIASRLRQEQGINGSVLTSGEIEGYEGYYNYFNIGASGTTNSDVIINGMKMAEKMEWDSHRKAIEGGAAEVAKKYTARGQDTLYLQKFDVDDSFDGLYWHQYMQNLQAANREGTMVRSTYEKLGILSGSFTFKIPVFDDMPDTPSPYPEDDYTPEFSLTKTSTSGGQAQATFSITNSESREINYTAVMLAYDGDILCGVKCVQGTLQSGESATPKLTIPKCKATKVTGVIRKH